MYGAYTQSFKAAERMEMVAFARVTGDAEIPAQPMVDEKPRKAPARKDL